MKLYRLPPIFLQSIIYFATRGLFFLFSGLEIRGKEHLAVAHGPVIFAANHSSEWDGPLIRACMPFFWSNSPMYYVSMMKEKYTDSGWRKVLYGGHFFNYLGAYPVYSGKHDYAYALQNHIKILEKGRMLCIFPEGRRTKDGTLSQAHGGAAFLSKELQVPIMPVSIKGLVTLKMGELLRGKRKVIVTFGKPLSPNEIVPATDPHVEDYKVGAKLIMQKIGDTLHG